MDMDRRINLVWGIITPIGLICFAFSGILLMTKILGIGLFLLFVALAYKLSKKDIFEDMQDEICPHCLGQHYHE